MRLNQPRITSLSDAEMSEEQIAAVEPNRRGRPLINVFRTMAHAPEALAHFTPWGAYILSSGNSLPVRQREIVILRVGFLCKSGYEFAQHARIGLANGLTPDEVAATKKGAAERVWSPADAALICMADELVSDHFVSDPTWTALATYFTQTQMMDAVYTACQYTQVSMFLNTFGVQPEEGLTIDSDMIFY